MVREILCLSLFLLAAVTGVARFRDKKSWDQASLWVSNFANFAGTLLLAISIFFDQQAVFLVPLSLLVFMHGLTFVYHNYFTQIIGLPLVIGELLLSFMFIEIRELFASPAALMIAFFFHMSFLGIVLKLILGLDNPQTKPGVLWSPYSLATRLDHQREQLKTLARSI